MQDSHVRPHNRCGLKASEHIEARSRWPPAANPPSLLTLYLLMCWTISLMNFNGASTGKKEQLPGQALTPAGSLAFLSCHRSELAIQIYYRLRLSSLIYHLEVWFDSECWYTLAFQGDIKIPGRRPGKELWKERWKIVNLPVELQNWDRFRMFP